MDEEKREPIVEDLGTIRGYRQTLVNASGMSEEERGDLIAAGRSVFAAMIAGKLPFPDPASYQTEWTEPGRVSRDGHHVCTEGEGGKSYWRSLEQSEEGAS